MEIKFEGKAYSFPDDFTPDEIGKALQSIPQPADWWKTLKGIPGTALGQAQQSLGGIAQAAGDLVRSDTLSEVGKGIAESGKINVEEAHPGEMGFWQRAVMGGVSSAAQQIPALAASVITGSPLPSLIAAGGLTFGGTYGEAKEAGLGGLRAGTTAGVDAAIEVVMERIPLKFLLDNVGGPVLKTIAGTLVREVPTEVATTALQQLNAMVNHKPDMTWEEYGQGILDTVGATMVSAPLLGGAASALAPLGPQRPLAGDVPDQTTQGSQPGDNNPPLTPPSNVAAAITPPGQTPPAGYDIPTGKPTAEQQELIKSLLSGLDPDTITPEQEAQAKATLAQIEKEREEAPKEVKEANAGVWGPFLNARTARDTHELAQTRKAARNAANYQNPNDLVAPDELKISFGPEEQLGKKLNETTPQKTTYVVGEPTEDRSAEYLGKLRDTVEGWRQKYMPNSTIVLSNETLFTDSATGWHYSEPNFHTIIPAVIRKMKDTGTFNTDTQRSAFLNASHEFGHALLSDRFFEGVDPVLAGQIMKTSEQGTVSEDLIAQMPEAQQKVLREFNALKKRIMDRSMTAQEFLEKWANPNLLKRKTWLKDLGLIPTSSAFDVGDALAKRAIANHRKKLHREGATLSTSEAKTLREALIRNYFSLHEFIAEQTTKHAYTQKWDQTSPLGQWFQNAMRELRAFFAGLKGKDQVVAPGVGFQEWLEGLTATDRQEKPAEVKVVERKKRAGAPKKVSEGKALEKPKKAPAKTAPKKVKRTQANVESDTNKPKEQVARGLVVSLVKDGTLETSDDTYKELMGLVKDQDWDAFKDTIQPLLGKKVKFSMEGAERDPLSVLATGLPEEHSRDPKILADAIREWKEKGFRSRYFKAWFGDWEDTAETGSLGNHSKVLDGEGKPLILYHWTDATDLDVPSKMHERMGFLEFKVGDLGFHFGTVRAAHVRSMSGNHMDYDYMSDNQLADYAGAKGTGRGGWMIPVVLNIRNPLDIGLEHQSIWSNRDGAVAFLETFYPDIWSPEDSLRALSMPNLGSYSSFAGVREILLEKGYDGIRYHNTYEGDTSYVAFHPNQVKSVIGNSTFSKSPQIHMELDFDRGSDSGTGASGLFRGVKNFLADPGPLRRALRSFQNLGYKVWNLQQLALLHPDLPELLSMNQANTAYNAYKSKLQAKADAVLAKWKELGKENFGKVNKFLLDEMRSGELWVGLQRQQNGTYVYVPTERTAQEMAARGIDITTEEGAMMAEIILEAKNALLGQLNEVENVLSTILSFRYMDKPEGLKAAFLPMVKQIHALRKQPFFPQGRFGNWMITVERKDAEGHWKIVHKEAFESQKQWEEAVREMQSRKVEGLRVRSHKLTDSKYVLMGLPQDFLDVAASELDLTESQVEHLTQLLQPIKTEKALRPYELQKLGITGYSEDAMRSFANYTWHNANLLAKMRYRSIFGADIRSIRSKLRTAQYANALPEVLRLEQVARYMESTRDFIMAPPYEAQTARAVVSVGYLAYNIKTALINFYGLVTTWSDLATRQGVLQGSGTLARATKYSWQSIDWAKALTLDPEALNTAKQGLPPDLQQALDQALREGVLSQSYAYHLAGMANSSNLFRLPAVGKAGQIGQKIVDVGMYPFRLVELQTRRITFLAEYESALRDKKMNPLEAYQVAVDRTNLLQNDYSLGNRAPFMRGIKTQSGNKVVEAAIPLATVFMTFMQHMAFHAYGFYETGQRRTAQAQGHDTPKWFNSYTAKIWIITLLLAGYEGLPGAENLLDLLEAAWRKWGGPKPLRQMMREFIQSVDGDPVFWSRGLGHNVGGFDISRSVGLGRFVPGTDALAHPRDSVAETFGVLALDAMGATGGFIKFGLETLFNDKKFSENIGRMPGGAGNIIAAIKWSQDGVLAPSGAKLTHDLETGELRDLALTEILGKGLGFNPTVVSQNREERFAQLDRKIYWSERRKMLLDDYWKATLQKDREAIADTKRAIEKFNSKIPPEIRSVRITGKDIQQSMQTRRRQLRADEQGTTVQKKYRAVYEDVGRSYDPPE